MPRFYTLPPTAVPYPFVIINANRPEPGLRYLQRWRRFIEAVIVDAGVEMFRDPGVREYPGGARAWIARVAAIYERVRRIVGDAEVYAVVPDYPDDYHHKQLWIDEQRTNIERTLDNIEYAISKYDDIDWMIPVQGHYEQPESVLIALEELEAVGALQWARRRTRYIALAMLCTSRKCSVIVETVRTAWFWLAGRGYSDLRVHVFGPAVNCVRRVATMIYSWDSLAWTRPRAPGGSSAWSEDERVYLFITWIHKYADIIDLPSHPKTMRKRVVMG